MALKKITREEANLTTWLLGQISLLEQQSGKKVTALDLSYEGQSGGTGINLQFEATEA
ncbi:hypothetical protein [Acinetobacter sp. A47]|uniref:hypothetical protein n=1 Tax=Acinetobacter sp. A47 TaxID=1561217 RepID=UPI000AA58B57|nr:hypothetical protein [Acinetobacter sp. A47]